MDRSLQMPTDLAACQALIQQQAQQLESQSRTIDAHVHTIESHALTIEELQRQKEDLRREHQELQLAFAELLQRAFQHRSERYLEDPNQLKLDFPGSDDAAAGLAEAIDEARSEVVTEQMIPAHTRRQRRPRREHLPEHLPRYEVEAPVFEEMKHCPQHGERKVIGYDVVETLEFERPKLRVRQTSIPSTFARTNRLAAWLRPRGKRAWWRGTVTTRAWPPK